MNNNPAVAIKNLSFSFGVAPILKQVNLQIETGKFYAVLGPNGSGKTTLLRTIAKLLEVKPDTIFINDQDIDHIRQKNLAKELAVVPQNTEVQFDFSVLDLVLMGRAPYLGRFATEGKADLELAREAMELTGTWELRDRTIQTLSGGERQRVIIARAITQNTGIILLDEPVSHLDLYHQIEILKQLKTLNRNKGVTVLAVFHDPNLAAAFSDYLIFMKQGKVHSIGAPEDILTQELIKEIYGVEVEIITGPEDGRVYLIPKLKGHRP